MKQFQFEFDKETALRGELNRVKRYLNSMIYKTAIIQIFTQITNIEEIEKITNLIDEVLPEVTYYGCQTGGTLNSGTLISHKTSAVITIFEYDDTEVEIVFLIQLLKENILTGLRALLPAVMRIKK